jgi:L-methionine (R)-S-oxide reductase
MNHIVDRLRGLEAEGSPKAAILKEAVRLIHEANPRFHWTGIYELHGQTLELGPYLGAPTEHARIAVGNGICGTAVAEHRNINVPNVAAVPNYLACSLETRSEIVVLIRQGSEIFGQIDIDSHTSDAFSPRDEQDLETVARYLAELYTR